VPYIHIEAGRMSKEQKEELIAGVTKVASETLNVKPEHFYVLIKENDPDNWGVGGETLSELFKKHPGF
jgi:4-oxalocrotonate tautomerase